SECPGGWGPCRDPRVQIEERHGFAGTLRMFGGLGAMSGPRVQIEERHGFAGTLRMFGGLGAMSGPPCSEEAPHVQKEISVSRIDSSPRGVHLRRLLTP